MSMIMLKEMSDPLSNLKELMLQNGNAGFKRNKTSLLRRGKVRRGREGRTLSSSMVRRRVRRHDGRKTRS